MSETCRPATAADQLPHAETAQAVLTALDQGWGGAAGWLADQGWTAQDVTRLRDRLTRP